MAEGPEESGLGMLLAAAEQELPSSEVGGSKVFDSELLQVTFFVCSCLPLQ